MTKTNKQKKVGSRLLMDTWMDIKSQMFLNFLFQIPSLRERQKEQMSYQPQR